MSDIYSNAAITLSATWASGPSQGCFVTPDAEYVPRTKAFQNNCEMTYELHCHEWIPRLQVPLHDRGWVFQERMLSKRIVHFMEQELWWECRHTTTCECRSEYHGKSTFGIEMNQIDRMLELSSPDEIQSYWEKIVTIYTTKSLTYPRDIFPGLQGLAKLVPPAMGRYFAGHWESTLAQSLCWYTGRRVTSKLEEWRAPSWSWAAAPGKVAWLHRGIDSNSATYATVLSAMTTPKGNDPMGQISHGVIVLRGRYLVGQVQIGPSSHIDLRLQSPFLTSGKFFSCYPIWDGTDLEDGTHIIALCLFIVDDPPYLIRHITRRKSYWLLLRAMKGAQRGYMRVGIFAEGHPGVVSNSNHIDLVLDEKASEGYSRLSRRTEGVVKPYSDSKNTRDQTLHLDMRTEAVWTFTLKVHSQ